MIKHYDDSKRYLTENSDLVCEDTANYLVVWCIDLEIEDVKTKLCYFIDLFLRSNKIKIPIKETRFDGTRGASMHRHAVHIRIK